MATKNLVTKEKLEKYFEITEKALQITKKNINKTKQKEAEEIIEMVSNYLADAKYFKTEKRLVDSFAAINYAHGWLDCGVRLGIFKVKDDKLFAIK